MDGVDVWTCDIYTSAEIPLDDYTDMYSYDEGTEIVPYANYNTYKATIPEPYLSYMEYYAAGLPIYEDYVIFTTQESVMQGDRVRTSTVYNFAHGDIDYNGNFIGNVEIDKIYASTNWFDQFVTINDSNFTLYPGGGLVFTNIPDTPYPDMAAQSKFQKYVVFLLVFFLLLSVLKKFFRR